MKPIPSSHFPWERLGLCLIAMGFILLASVVHHNWLSYYVVLDPTKTASREGITALTAMTGIQMTAITAIAVFFMTGSTATILGMFKFNSSALSSAVSSTEDAAQTLTEDVHIPKAAHFDDLDEIP